MKWPLKKIETTTVKNVLLHYEDHLDDDGHVSVTDWANGEGFDIDIAAGKNGHGGDGHIAMTHSQWAALKKAVKELYKSPYSLVGRTGLS